MVDIEPTQVLADIEKALKSSKVDPYLLHQFSIVRSHEGVNTINIKVPFLAQIKSGSDFKSEWICAPLIGNILGIMSPYSAIPQIVNNPDVVKIDASRPSATED